MARLDAQIAKIDGIIKGYREEAAGDNPQFTDGDRVVLEGDDARRLIIMVAALLESNLEMLKVVRDWARPVDSGGDYTPF